MSETTDTPQENIESKQIRKFPGTPVTGDILKHLLDLDRKDGIANQILGIDPKYAPPIHIELLNRDGDELHLLLHPSKNGMFFVCGPSFFEVDPDKPETFEFLELVVRNEDCGVSLLEGIRNEAREKAKRVSTPQPTCPYGCVVG